MTKLDRFKRLLPGQRRATPGPDGLVPAGQITAHARAKAAAQPAPAPADAELLARRERLTERFAAGQAELGGVLYEMAIRDHVRLDVLTRKAAALQRIDLELGDVERELRGELAEIGGTCRSCGTRHAREARFCSGCGASLNAGAGATGAAGAASNGVAAR
ncbi:MAG: hypothetical protein QM679_01835 [Patulibacter sp.]